MPNATNRLARTLQHRRHACAAMSPCTRLCRTGAITSPNPNHRSSLGHHEAIAMLTQACHGRRWSDHRRAAPPSDMGAVQHGRRPASSSEPPGRPTPPVDAHGGGEHDGDDRATRDLAVGEFATGQTTSLRCASDRWGHANRGA